MSRARIDLPRDSIAEFCRRRHGRWLALFGSVLRDDFRPDSDVDVLVEFEPRAGAAHGGFGRWTWVVSRRPSDVADLIAATRRR